MISDQTTPIRVIRGKIFAQRSDPGIFQCKVGRKVSPNGVYLC
jgi:hypothetical protein